MNKPKIIFFDVDGTLVPLKGAARPRTLEALRRLHQNGIRLCIATGRAPMEVPKFEGVSFDAFLTYNGSYCFTPEQDIFKNTIPTEEVATLIRNAAALGRPVALANTTRLAANGSEPDLEEYFAIGGVELKIAEDFEEMAKGEIFQVLMGGREEEYPAILKDVPMQRSRRGGIGLWTSFRPAAARGLPWKRCWSSMASPKPIAWRSEMATMIWRCLGLWAPVWLWAMPLRS